MSTVREVLAKADIAPVANVFGSPKQDIKETALNISATTGEVSSSSTPSGEVEKTQANKILIGRSTAGQNIYPVESETTPELWDWNVIIWKAATKKHGLDPYPVVYWICKRDQLLQAAAKGGFPVNIPHWKNGMAFKELSIGHQYQLQKIYEMIINNNPSHAYLQEGNEIYDQKLVMCHCMGHSDFFKNNIWFKNTNRNMIDRIAEHADYIRNLQNTKRVAPVEIEYFLDKVFSIDDLIDVTNLQPESIQYETLYDKEAISVPDNYGVVDTKGMPSHIAKRLNDPVVVQKIQEEERTRREEELRKLPRHPDRDVLGFIIKHSTVLMPWQRRVLGFVREQAYYFVPQGMTKVMNEGWAVYWHQKLMNRSDIKDYSHIVQVAAHNAGTLAMSKFNFNPYAVGFAIFKDIEERWNKGQHGHEWDGCDDRKARREWDTKEMKGQEKIFDVRRRYKDTEFIDEFLTPEVAEELQLFKYEKKSDSEPYKITSRDFKVIKKQIVGMISNSGRPAIEVIDGNHNNTGELLLNHVWAYDLKVDEAHETLKNILLMWGRPVHLDTKITDVHGDKPIRITVDFIKFTDQGKTQFGTRIRHYEKYEHEVSSTTIYDGREGLDEEDIKYMWYKVR